MDEDFEASNNAEFDDGLEMEVGSDFEDTNQFAEIKAEVINDKICFELYNINTIANAQFPFFVIEFSYSDSPIATE